MNKKYLIIILLVLTIVIAAFSLTKGKKGIPVSNTTVSIKQNQGNYPLAESAIQSEGMSFSGLTVNYGDEGFTPQEITVRVGETVTWTNNSNKPLWVASDNHPTHDLYPGFDQLNSVESSGQYSFLFNKVGTWGYHNHLAPNQTGRVTVTQ